jgi:tetratricopeptide (TPR) repeat protein
MHESSHPGLGQVLPWAVSRKDDGWGSIFFEGVVEQSTVDDDKDISVKEGKFDEVFVMKHHTAYQAALAMLFVFFSAFCAAGGAWADNFSECLNGKLGNRIAACSAAIDDPATKASDLESALNNRSIDLMIAGRFADSIQDLDRALQINPRSAMALNGRAWTLYRWKNTADGMNDVNESLRIDGTYAPAWDTRAHLYQLLGVFDRAFNEYEAAVGFGGENFVRTYQCGLKERGLYKGPIDGNYSAALRDALRTCAFSAVCDPLPKNEFEQDCESATS